MPEKVWADLEKEMQMDGLMAELIPIYVEATAVNAILLLGGIEIIRKAMSGLHARGKRQRNEK